MLFRSGWFAGFKFLPSDDWSINLTYGTSRVWKVSHAYPDFKYGLDARISAFYKMTPWLQSGIEYLWGKHQTFDHKHGQVSRIQTVMMFTL